MLRPLMHHFERRLHARDDGARVSHPFEWGLEFLDAGLMTRLTILITRANSSRNSMRRRSLASDGFYTPPPSRQSDFESSDVRIRLSPVEISERGHHAL